MKIGSLLTLIGTLTAIVGAGLAVHKMANPKDPAIYELARLNLEALTYAEAQPTKAAEKTLIPKPKNSEIIGQTGTTIMTM